MDGSKTDPFPKTPQALVVPGDPSPVLRLATTGSHGHTFPPVTSHQTQDQTGGRRNFVRLWREEPTREESVGPGPGRPDTETRGVE